MRRNGQILETPEPRNLLLAPTGDGGATKTLKLETPDLSSEKRCRHRKEVAPVHVGGLGDRMEVIDSGCERVIEAPIPLVSEWEMHVFELLCNLV